MLLPVLVLAVLASLLVIFCVVGFNKLRTSDIAALEALSGVDVQLTRRADLIPNLVNTVKGYAAHERAVFEEVSSARAGAAAAAKSGNVEDKAQAAALLDHAVFRVLAVAEAYPELKASAGFLQLQSQLADAEAQLSFARQFYNDAVATLNTLVATFPWLLLAGTASVSRRAFYAAPDDQRAAPQVKF